MSKLRRGIALLLALAIVMSSGVLQAFASDLTNYQKVYTGIRYYAQKDSNSWEYHATGTEANNDSTTIKDEKGKAIAMCFIATSAQNAIDGVAIKDNYGKNIYFYCIEHGVGQSTYTERTATVAGTNAYWHSLTQSARNGIEIALLCGFPQSYLGGTACDAYAATQLVIWEFQKGIRTVNIDTGVMTASGSFATNLSGSALTAYNNLVASIANFLKRPSFSGSTTLTWNATNGRYETTLTDVNGVLSNYYVTNQAALNASGLYMSKSGNSITLYSASGFSGTKTLSFKHTVNASRYYSQGLMSISAGSDTQEGIVGQAEDPITAYLNVTTSYVGGLQIKKLNEDGQLVPGYTFQITHTGTGTKYSAVTDANGIASFSNLPIGTYSVTEDLDANKTNFPQYTIQNISNVTVNSNATSSLTVTNNYVTGQLKIYKTDGETKYPVAGAKFGVYSDANCTNLIETVITDSTGTATTSKLRYGTYYFKELEAPEGYLLEESTFDVTITADGQVVDKTVENDYISGYLKIYKTDGETKTPVRGAKFGVYTKQDISFGGKTYKAGDLVDTVVTDANGEATTKALRYGSYYFKELEAPEGYILDENSFDVTISVNGKTEEKEVVNDYISGHLKIYKTDGETKYPVSDAVFGVYTKQDISFGGKTYKAGDIVDTVTTDKNGEATTKALRYGSYYFKELVAPAGYLLEESSFDFKITTNNATVERTVENDYIAGYLKIYKTDGETKTPVRDAVFDVYTKQDISFGGKTYKAGDLVDTVTTDENGEAVTKELRYGSYYFKERTAPYGYILEEKSAHFDITTHNETVKITVDEAVKYLNLEVYKKGEALTGFTETETDFGTQYTPIYKEQYLAGAVYDVYAAEDIVIGGTGASKDGDKGTRTIYKKGELVDTITTVSTGKALSKDLPVGEYTVKERIAPNGYFIGDNSETVDLQTKNESVVFDNDRTKLTIDFTKYIEENENYPNPDAYKDMVFALYAKNDICDIDGNVLLEADSLASVITIDKTVTTQASLDENGDPLLDEDGNPVMEEVVTYIDTDASDLPIADYYLKEVKTAEGYVLNETVFEVPFATNITVDTKDKDGNVITRYNQDIDMWTEDVGEIVNNVYRGTFGFEKTSSFDGRKLEGATYGIYRASDDELIYTLETDENGIAAQKDIPYGEYYLQEIQPPQFKLTNSIVVEKYYLNEEKIYFSINDKELPVQHVYTTNDAKFGTLVPIQEETPLIYIPKDLITIDVDTPLTGDSTPIAGTVAILCTSALGVMVMKMKRKEVENDE